MKILYGIQATGNGHINRSRVMALELEKAGIDVDYLFSGRELSKYYDLDAFKNKSFRKGLSFVVNGGKIDYWKTFTSNDISTLLRDIDNLDLSEYDLVISDYEPITAWAAKLQNKECIGIGHQYAFNYDIPKSHFNFISKLVMKYFAPVDINIGLHWHHFGTNIYPPIIDPLEPSEFYFMDKILVYLGFEDKGTIIDLFTMFPGYSFVVYGHDCMDTIQNITFVKSSNDGFKNDLKTCDGVICNAGFELVSEALHLGKKILVKPLTGQAEQHSNATALDLLSYGTTMDDFDVGVIRYWLDSEGSVTVKFPNVAKHLVEWIQTDRKVIPPKQDIWDLVRVIK